jgi:type II secretory ATPase GspE/PulE/Tfp pilus assembly ATPase PilB-like protein
MGAEPFLLASALKLIVAQRLVRVNCPDCVQTTAGEDQRLAAMKLGVEPISVRVSLGCNKCRHTGFMGRTAIVECLSVSEQIKAALSTNGTEQSILETAVSEGFVPMKDLARKLVTDGKTTPIEAYQELSS